jgi:hypothetical protein
MNKTFDYQFKEQYIDSNGDSWECYCQVDIYYRLVSNSIDYPNGLVRHVTDIEIEDCEIYDLSVFKDSETVLEGEDIPEDMVKFFNDVFDPETLKESI